MPYKSNLYEVVYINTTKDFSTEECMQIYTVHLEKGYSLKSSAKYMNDQFKNKCKINPNVN